MFGMGMGEIVLIAVVALLVLGPERLPSAAKAIGKGIRDLRQQSKELQTTIEADTQIGDAVREIRGALRGDPENLYKQVTGDDWDESESESISSILASAKAAGESDNEGKASNDGEPDKASEPVKAIDTKIADDSTTAESAETGVSPNAVSDLIDNEFANTDDSWGEEPINPHVVDPKGATSSDNSESPDNTEDSDMVLIRPAANTMARQEALDDTSDDGDARDEGNARNDSDNV